MLKLQFEKNSWTTAKYVQASSWFNKSISEVLENDTGCFEGEGMLPTLGERAFDQATPVGWQDRPGKPISQERVFVAITHSSRTMYRLEGSARVVL